MPTVSQTDAQHRSPRAPRSRAADRRRGALRALLAAFAAVRPHSAFQAPILHDGGRKDQGAPGTRTTARPGHHLAMLNTTGSGLGARKAIAPRSIEIMARGSRGDFAEILRPEFFNHEQRDEPSGTRGPGPDGTTDRSSAVIKAREAGLGREPHRFPGPVGSAHLANRTARAEILIPVPLQRARRTRNDP